MSLKKTLTSVLIPYCFKDEVLYVFLQRRSDDAPRGPNFLGAFGGAVEDGETNIQAFNRELQEELNYTPRHYEELGAFETDGYCSTCYIENVAPGFEDHITINEGKGGEWHAAKEVEILPDVMPNTRKALRAMLEKLV